MTWYVEETLAYEARFARVNHVAAEALAAVPDGMVKALLMMEWEIEWQKYIKGE